MSEVITADPAAGWYQDPNDGGSMRWWDGEGWTDHTQPIAPAPAPAAHGASASSAGTDWVSNYTEDELALYTGRTNEHTVSSDTGRTVLEFSGTIPDWRRDRTNAGTGAVWLLALTPLLVVGMAVVWQFLGAGMEIPPPVLLAVPGAISALTILFAIVDSRTLRARGVAAPSAWWILLGPIGYLIARAVAVRRTKASSIAPLVVYLIVSVALGVVLTIASAALLAMLHPSSGGPADAGQGVIAKQTAQVIQTDLVSKGQNWTVDCGGANVRIAPNSSFRCVATNTADASHADVDVVLDAQQHLSYKLVPTP